MVSAAGLADEVWNTLPRERILPNEARRECARDLTVEATVLGFGSTLSVMVVVVASAGDCCRCCETAESVAAGGAGGGGEDEGGRSGVEES